MTSLTLRVDNLTKENAATLEQALLGVAGVSSVDTWAGRAIVQGDETVTPSVLLAAAAAAGFTETHVVPSKTVVRIDGMTCRSCELTIEREFKGIAGISAVSVDAVKGIATVTSESAPDMAALTAATTKAGYRLLGTSDAVGANGGKTSFAEAALLFALAIGAGLLLSRLGLSSTFSAMAGGVTFFGALTIGLVAGSSSCMAVSGGLLLSAVGTFRRKYGGDTLGARMTPVGLFSAGRVASYVLFGAIIGALGNALSPSPLVTAAVTLAAAVYMIVAGLDMLKLTPPWLAQVTPRMPKAISRRVLDAEGNAHPTMPVLLGAGTFFLPCGFTQALQLYALSTGSAAGGAVVLGGFAIGTIPALLALGWASGALKGRLGELFFKFSGAVVVMLGLWNVQNGFTLAGYPLRLPQFGAPATMVAAADPNVRVEGDVQVVDVTLTAEEPYYQPSNRFTVKAGSPVRLVMHGFGMGCRSVFQIPRAGISTPLAEETNVVEFTPDRAGEYAFSCSMGMYPGAIVAVES